MREFVEKECPLLWRVVKANMDLTEDVANTPKRLNRVLAPLGLDPPMQGSEEKEESCRRVEAFLQTLSEEALHRVTQPGDSEMTPEQEIRELKTALINLIQIMLSGETEYSDSDLREHHHWSFDATDRKSLEELLGRINPTTPPEK